MLSVVIPTHNSARALVPTLAMLVPAAITGAVREVIIAEGGSSDATAEIADLAGCAVHVSDAPLATRLKSAAAAARAPWLLFLRPGIVLDATWAAETLRFVEDAERRGTPQTRAAVFRKAPPAGAGRPVLLEAFALLKAALGAAPHPEQGLVISRGLYDQLGGHREAASEPEADLLGRLGHRRIVMLRSGATAVGRE